MEVSLCGMKVEARAWTVTCRRSWSWNHGKAYVIGSRENLVKGDFSGVPWVSPSFREVSESPAQFVKVILYLKDSWVNKNILAL